MASQPPATPSLPLFYAGLEPLSSSQHSNYRVRERTAAPHLANVHAIPLTSDEFVSAQRFYPIVFSVAALGRADPIQQGSKATGPLLEPLLRSRGDR